MKGEAKNDGVTRPSPAGKLALVHSADADGIGGLRTILEFLGYGVVETPDRQSLAWRLAEEGDAVEAVVIQGNWSEAEQKALAELFEQTTGAPLPVVLYQVPAEGAPPIVLHYPAHWPLVPLPLTQDRLSEALEKSRARKAPPSKGRGGKRRPPHLFRSLIGRSPAIQRIREAIEQAGPTDANVLILGESGTGKEVVARNVHYFSKRRDKPFVPVNCGAIPKDLLESELFGHVKGAFTGAFTAREGRFSLAAGGTLFLDEIGEMPMEMQVKLLRVLEERTFERVGGTEVIEADVRIIAATNRDLETMVKEGKFRQDLFFRLEVFPIELPPLRERIEDLPLLIAQLNERLEHEKNCSVRLSPGAVQVLSHYSWPGNVRELANLMERLAIQFPNRLVEAQDLPPKYRQGLDEGQLAPPPPMPDQVEAPRPAGPGAEVQIPPGGLDLKSYISEMEMQLIRQALAEANGVVAHAAKLLGLRRTTLSDKMRKYGMRSD